MASCPLCQHLFLSFSIFSSALRHRSNRLTRDISARRARTSERQLVHNTTTRNSCQHLFFTFLLFHFSVFFRLLFTPSRGLCRQDRQAAGRLYWCCRPEGLAAGTCPARSWPGSRSGTAPGLFRFDRDCPNSTSGRKMSPSFRPALSEPEFWSKETPCRRRSEPV